MINYSILRALPEIELPYEYITHKEAHSEFYTAIPFGKKYLAWFTYIGNNNVCITMEINIKNLRIYNLSTEPEVCSFHSELSYGTIFYGTIQKSKYKTFIIENILYYKGNKIENADFIDKLSLFKTIFTNEICNTLYLNKQMVFSLPVMHTNKVEFNKIVNRCNYNIYCIQMRPLYGQTVNVNYINKNKKCIFIVKPVIKSDIYELYTIENKYTGNAYINTYKKSIFMNSIFRKIKENIRLDTIEESDSDDDFENINVDKYIIKEHAKMQCEYNLEHKQWIPIKVVD